MKIKGVVVLLLSCIVTLKSQDINVEYSKLLKEEDWLSIRNAIEKGVDINTKDELGNTALHWSAERNNWMFFIWLAVHDADVSLQNNKGNTPLSVAKKYNSEDVISFLNKEYEPMELYIQYTLGVNSMFSTSYDGILEELEKASAYCSREYDDSSPTLAISYNYIGVLFSKEENYKETRHFYEKSYDFFKRESKRFPERYALVMNNLGLTYARLGEIDLAVEMYSGALKVRKKIYGEESAEYAASLGNLGSLYSNTGDYEKALPLLETAKKISDNILTIYDGGYGKAENDLAGLYENMNLYPEAESLYKEALKKGNTYVKPFSMKYATRLANLGILYQRMGDYTRALEYLNKANNVEKTFLGKKNPRRSYTLNNLAIMHQKIGDYENALRIFLEVRETEKKNGKDVMYAETTGALGNLYYEMGQKEKSLDLHLDAKSVFETNNMKNQSYGAILNNLSLLSSDIGEYDQSIDYQKEALQFIKEKYGTRHELYRYSMINLSHTLFMKGDHDESKEQIEKAKNIIEGFLDENRTDYGYYCHNIGAIYSLMGLHEEGLEFTFMANKIFKKNLGENNHAYIFNLQNISQTYFLLKEFDLSLEYAKNSAEIYNRNIIKHTSFLSERDVLSYMSLKRNKDNVDYFQSLLLLSGTDDFVELNYNIQLNTQARAMQNNINAKLNVLSTNDSLLLNMYNNYTTLRYQYSRVYLMSESELKKRGISLKQLKKQISDLETQLSLSSEPLKRQMAFQKQEVDFSDISNALNKNEASIDYTHFQYHNGEQFTDTIIYAAYLTLPDKKQPVFINLGTEKQIEKLLGNSVGDDEAMNYVESIETGNELYELIFAPLEVHLKGLSSLHISGSGLLHEIALHVLRKGNKYLMDDYEVHYHGSMRDFVMDRREGKYEKDKGSNIALFGNPNFNASLDTVEQQGAIQRDSSLATRGNWSGFDSLPETKNEVETIGTYARKKKWQVKPHIGISANEANFKSLSGKKISIIHLATHGYSLKRDKEARNTQLLSSNQERITRQKDPLFRSGLALSGANKTWEANTFPTTEEDGLLTAYEISTMDLFNTDLVVLSACNTGLGDILSGEGVFGLQRAFKTAGVKNTIVSLWEVDDEATRLLMEYFYKNYFEGKTAYESLKLAQEKMRKGKFSEPYYWAGFILIE